MIRKFVKGLFIWLVVIFVVFAIGNLFFILDDVKQNYAFDLQNVEITPPDIEMPEGQDLDQLNTDKDITPQSEPNKPESETEPETEPEPEPDPEPNPLETNGQVSGDLTQLGIVEETNRHRSKHGYNKLTQNEKLNSVAELKIEDMFEKEYFAHTSPSGEEAGDVAREVNYNFIKVGENLAKGEFKNDADLVQGWMDSPGHRENILTEEYEEIGVAAKKDFYEGNKLWLAVQIFGMPEDACPIVDEELLDTIKAKENNAESKAERLNEMKEEINSSSRSPSLINEYNELAAEYNDLMQEIDNLADQYNQQVKTRNECIEK